jgi:NADH-quinone oxidoreductase subunit J
VKSFGYGLMTKYMLPLQISGFLLLAAMVGVIVLSKNNEKEAG